MQCNLRTIQTKQKMTNPWKTFSILMIVLLNFTPIKAAQFDDEVSLRKVRLQDLESEQSQREYEREGFERLQQQQPPMPPAQNTDRGSSHSVPNEQRGFYGRMESNRNSNVPLAPQHFLAQSVRPLEQPISKAKPIQIPSVDYASAAASSFNFGLSPLTHNGAGRDTVESDTFSIVTFSHNDPPLPLHLRRGAGYDALSSADVLLPPFHDNKAESFFNGRYQAQHASARPLPIGNAREHIQPPAEANFGSSNHLPDLPEFSNGYLPLNKFGSHKQSVRYGSPQASFRRPNIHAQSNQLAFAPQRPEGYAQSSSAAKVPFPPSFITLTTQRPEANYIPMTVRPLGRFLGYNSQFHPSAVDPVPDFFANRQSKSLLDSYIPSWVVPKMLEEQRKIAFGRSSFGDFNGGNSPNGAIYLKRALFEPALAQPRIDETNLQTKDDDIENNSKIVKK